MITIEEAARLELEIFNKMKPAERELAVYILQSKMGGFPVDQQELERLCVAADNEKRRSCLH